VTDIRAWHVNLGKYSEAARKIGMKHGRYGSMVELGFEGDTSLSN
jgi:hypothetical protein